MKLIDKSLLRFALTAPLIYTHFSEASKAQIKHPQNTQKASIKKIDSDCIRKVSSEDNIKISEFIYNTKKIRETSSLTQEEKNIQINTLINEYSNSISPDGLNALVAVYSRENLDQLFELLESDNKAKEAYKAYLNSFKKLSKTRNNYLNTSSLFLSITRAPKLEKAANDFTLKGNELIQTIKVSKINEIYKNEMIKGIYQHQISEAALNGDAGSRKAQDAETSMPYFMAGLPIVVIGAAYLGLAAGATATASGITTIAGGAGASAPTVTTPSAVIAGMLKASLYGAASGGLGAYTYGQARGLSSLIVGAHERRKYLNDEFMCAYVNEVRENGAQLQKNALSMAAWGAGIGSTAGGVASLGGIYTTLIQGLGLTASGTATILSASNYFHKAQKAEMAFREAQKEAELGNEEAARNYLLSAASLAKESKISGLDTAIAALGAYKTGQAFLNSLKHPPQGLLDQLASYRKEQNEKLLASQLKTEIPVSQSAMLDAVNGKPKLTFIKDAPIAGYQITSDRFEDIPDVIRQHLGSVDSTQYTQAYLAQNKGSIIALQMNGDKPDFYIIGKDTFMSKYKPVPLTDVGVKNPKLITKLRSVAGMDSLLQKPEGLVGALKTTPVEMVKMSQAGYAVQNQVTIESPWGIQVKPNNQDAYLVYDSSSKQYYMVNSSPDGKPIGYASMEGCGAQGC